MLVGSWLIMFVLGGTEGKSLGYGCVSIPLFVVR